MPDAPNVMETMRTMALTTTFERVGITPLPNGIWGAVVDFALPAGLATIVTLADGTTSLYLATGGGTIGAGAHAAVRNAGAKLLKLAGQHLERFTKTTEYAPPAPGNVGFFLLKSDGVYASAPLAATVLTQKKSELSDLFWAANDVLTEVLRLTKAG
jgi:hypothetical protein